MIVTRVPRWMWRLQHVSFALWLATPAYFATIDILASRGIGLAWYHRAGVAVVCLLSAAAVMMLPGIMVGSAFWLARRVRSRPGTRV